MQMKHYKIAFRFDGACGEQVTRHLYRKLLHKNHRSKASLLYGSSCEQLTRHLYRKLLHKNHRSKASVLCEFFYDEPSLYLL